MPAEVRWVIRTIAACVVLAIAACDRTPSNAGDAATPGADAEVVPPIAVSCTPDAGAIVEPDPARARVVTGVNATLSDTCDLAGNLQKARCASLNLCGSGVNPVCHRVETGEAALATVDCDGLCLAGVCASGCPQPGDSLTVTSTDEQGQVGFRNERDGRHYLCTVISQQAVAYDCARSPVVGAAQSIVGLGLHGLFCTGKSFGNIATGPTPPQQACTYQCDIVP